MWDRSKVRKKVIVDLLTCPRILYPFLAGTTSIVGLWTFDVSSPWIMLASSLGILWSLGSLATGFLLNGEQLAQKAIADLQLESERTRQQELDQLDEELSKDKDKRDESLLRDLRVLLGDLKDSDVLEKLNAVTAFDMLSDIQQLFDESVNMLKKSFEIKKMAAKLRNKMAKEEMLNQREQLLADVDKTVQQIGRILAEMQSMIAGDVAVQEQIHSKLADNLSVARRVKERMAKWDDSHHLAELRELNELGSKREIAND